MESALLFAPSTVTRSEGNPLVLTPTGTQFLPVSGHITDRLLVTYRVAADRLAQLVPPPLRLDTRAGCGFLSICAVEILGMGLSGMPSLLRFDNRELLYRLAVRLGDEPSFLTLRSDVSSRALSVLGRRFSHYRPRRARVGLQREPGRLRFETETGDGLGDAVLEVDTAVRMPDEGSIFRTDEAAAAFLLGMKFSVDAIDGRARVQPITHSLWSPRSVRTTVARFAFIKALEEALGTPFVFDGTLLAQDIHQTWGAARWR
jgi:hypothetical protein